MAPYARPDRRPMHVPSQFQLPDRPSTGIQARAVTVLVGPFTRQSNPSSQPAPVYTEAARTSVFLDCSIYSSPKPPYSSLHSRQVCRLSLRTTPPTGQSPCTSRRPPLSSTQQPSSPSHAYGSSCTSSQHIPVRSHASAKVDQPCMPSLPSDDMITSLARPMAPSYP